MEKDTNQQNLGSPVLCAKCMSFYANPQFAGYCSKCYKEVAVEKQQDGGIKQSEGQANADAQQTETKPMIKQEDHSICWSCKKKAGMMGYKCKCEYTFCKKHRMPEAHQCEFDFVNEGKTLLTKFNPNLQPDKLEKI